MNNELTNGGKFGEFIEAKPIDRHHLELLRLRCVERCKAEQERIGKPVYAGPGSSVVATDGRIECVLNLTTDPLLQNLDFGWW